MKHPQFLTDILNHPDISPADKETAKAEVERMMADRGYANSVNWSYGRGRPNTMSTSFTWSHSDSGRDFWRNIYLKFI
jgi:hypothetical protein